jgi:predicted membrane protein
MVIDLNDTKLAPGTTRILATVVGGRILVHVPPGAAVEVHARAGAGQVSLFGRTYDGVNVDVSRTFGGAPAPGRTSVLRLDLEVSLGQVQVDSNRVEVNR